MMSDSQHAVSEIIMDILNKSHAIHRNGDAEKLLKLMNVAVLEAIAIHSLYYTLHRRHIKMKSTIYNSFRVYNISNKTVFSLTSFLPVPDKPENVTILITPV